MFEYSLLISPNLKKKKNPINSCKVSNLEYFQNSRDEVPMEIFWKFTRNFPPLCNPSHKCSWFLLRSCMWPSTASQTWVQSVCWRIWSCWIWRRTRLKIWLSCGIWAVVWSSGHFHWKETLCAPVPLQEPLRYMKGFMAAGGTEHESDEAQLLCGRAD